MERRFRYLCICAIKTDPYHKIIPGKMKASYFIAFDLGATSGRCVLGELRGKESLSMKELTRFPNQMMPMNGHLYWNIYSLYDELKRGLREVAKSGITPASIGIDTWGVDYVCIASDGSIIGLPYAYRDAQTLGASQRFFKNVMSASQLYGRTGIQHLDFNTVFQLNEHRSDFSHRNASRYVFLPDALAYMLTGNAVTEYTIASTGALIDARRHCLDEEVLEAVGCDASKFGPLVMPGAVVGMLKEDIAAEVGLQQVPVISVAGHDTASAVAAIPAEDRNFAYLSSGTWSLMGIETDAPVINAVTETHNITNEGGVEGTVRLLKNITGMWIIEQCLKRWKSEGIAYSYPEMVALAESSKTVCIIDPDDSSFTAPSNMVEAIDNYCRATGQTMPSTHGEYIRSIFDSLADKYAKTLDVFRGLSEYPIDRLHVIGGGSRNAFLNQVTAEACGIPVVAGPAEATAIGNIMIQAMAAGEVANLAEMRKVIAGNIETETYYPKNK